jgi:hypothetical protein
MASRNTLAEIIHPRRFAMQASYVWLWRDSEVSERAPHFRLLKYTGPVRHTCGKSKMTRCGRRDDCAEKHVDRFVG